MSDEETKAATAYAEKVVANDDDLNVYHMQKIEVNFLAGIAWRDANPRPEVLALADCLGGACNNLKKLGVPDIVLEHYYEALSNWRKAQDEI